MTFLLELVIRPSISCCLRYVYENVFEQITRGLYCIDTDEDETCVFSFLEGNRIACSLYTVAEQLGSPSGRVNPESCLLWLLAIFEGKTRILSIHDDAFEFSCNTQNAKRRFSLCPSSAQSIKRVFGIKFRDELQNAANKRLRWTSIPLREQK